MVPGMGRLGRYQSQLLLHNDSESEPDLEQQQVLGGLTGLNWMEESRNWQYLGVINVINRDRDWLKFITFFPNTYWKAS